MIYILVLALAAFLPLTAGHVAIWHPSMWGFNVTAKTFPYDNRPVTPLMQYTFEKWWFHGHLNYPPSPGAFFELPAGKPATAEIACDKAYTSFGAKKPTTDGVCPGSPVTQFHTTGLSDVKGCALAIAYKSDVTQVQPEDFTVFSVNQTCVWTRETNFPVPAKMPACPAGGCTCAFFWIHSPDAGSEQNYMNGFKCNVTGATSNVAVAKSQVPRRCGADPLNGKPTASPGNCTYGAKTPLYWLQAERNNMFEGPHAPPFYNDLYNFKDGAQNDIFQDSYPNGIPAPNPSSTVVPTPNGGGNAAIASATSFASAPASSVPASSPAVPSPGPSSSAKSASPSAVPSPIANPVSVSTVTVVSTQVVTVTDTVPASSAVSVTNAAAASESCSDDHRHTPLSSSASTDGAAPTGKSALSAAVAASSSAPLADPSGSTRRRQSGRRSFSRR